MKFAEIGTKQSLSFEFSNKIEQNFNSGLEQKAFLC